MHILLDSAVKCSAGDVRLTADWHDEQVEIRVQDYGPGIAADQLDKVIDCFWRGDEAAKRPGFGLGLPKCKALTEGMREIIAMKSEPAEGARSSCASWRPIKSSAT